MRYDRATAFTHDRWMRDAFRVTNIHDIPHDIVGVFLERIICRAIEVATRAVVIDAKPAADIQISEFMPKLGNLCVITGRFADRALDN